MQVPLTKNPESSTWNPQSKIVLPSWIPLHGVNRVGGHQKNNGRKDEHCVVKYVMQVLKAFRGTAG